MRMRSCTELGITSEFFSKLFYPLVKNILECPCPENWFWSALSSCKQTCCSGMSLEWNRTRRWVKSDHVNASAGIYLPSGSCGLKFWGGPWSTVSVHSEAAMQGALTLPELGMVWLDQHNTRQLCLTSFWLHQLLPDTVPAAGLVVLVDCCGTWGSMLTLGIVWASQWDQ